MLYYWLSSVLYIVVLFLPRRRIPGEKKPPRRSYGVAEMLNRIDEVQKCFGRICYFFRIRAVQLASFVLFYAVITSPLIVGECFAQAVFEENPAALTKPVDVVRANDESSRSLTVDIKQQPGAKAVGDLNKSLPLVSPNGKVVSSERENKPGNSGDESSYSVYVLGIHALFLLAGVFYAGVIFYACSIARERREDFRCLMRSMECERAFHDNVSAMVGELWKLKNRPCNDVIFEFMYKRGGLASPIKMSERG